MSETVLTVENPWGWLWWPQGRPLQRQDPNVVDANVRKYPGQPVDWPSVVAAVTLVVQACSDVTDVTERDRDVSIPVSLSTQDHLVAQRWLYGNVGIMPRVQQPDSDENRRIGDRRHRLWATWDLFDGLVPIMSNTALYFNAAYPQDLDGIAVGLKAEMRDERRWWLMRSGWDLFAPNRQYVRNLRACIKLI